MHPWSLFTILNFSARGPTDTIEKISIKIPDGILMFPPSCRDNNFIFIFLHVFKVPARLPIRIMEHSKSLSKGIVFHSMFAWYTAKGNIDLVIFLWNILFIRSDGLLQLFLDSMTASVKIFEFKY